YGDHTGIQATEERRNEVEAGWIQQERSVARTDTVRAQCDRNRSSLLVDLSVRQASARLLAVVQESVAHCAMRDRRTLAQDVDECLNASCHTSTAACSRVGVLSASVTHSGRRPVVRIARCTF